MAFSRILILSLFMSFVVIENVVARDSRHNDGFEDFVTYKPEKFLGKWHIIAIVKDSISVGLSSQPPPCLQLIVNNRQNGNLKIRLETNVNPPLNWGEFEAKIHDNKLEELGDFPNRSRLKFTFSDYKYDDEIVLKGKTIILILSRSTSISRMLNIKYLKFAIDNDWRFRNVSIEGCA